MITTPKPLVVDLDGTLMKSDTLFESLFGFIKKYPGRFYQPLIWLLQGGKAYMKSHLIKRVHITAKHLPYDEQVIDWLRKEKASGRKLILATASHKHYADQIAAHLQLFDDVIATTDINLASKNKTKVLIELFGEKGFDYVGNSMDDIHVWQAANHAIVVNPEPGVERRARKLCTVTKVIHSNPHPLKPWLKALRLQQWLKNVFISIPLFTNHHFTYSNMSLGLIAFILFGLCTSSFYLLNDLLDLEADRHHATKRHRPFAAGTLSIKVGVILAPLLLLMAVLGALWLLPWQFTLVLIIYYVLTLAYSLKLKHMMIVNVIIFATLYTLQIVAGAVALNLALPLWTLCFSMFIFLGLGFIKRYMELHHAKI